MDQVSVKRLDGEHVFTLEDWIALDWEARIAEIRSGHLHFLSKGKPVSLEDAIAVASRTFPDRRTGRSRRDDGA